MAPSFSFQKNSIALLVAAASLSLSSGAWAVACPSASGGQILVDNITVTATCTLPNLQNIVVTSTGTITTNYPNPAVFVASGTEIGSVVNAGTVQSRGNALQVQGMVDGNITNDGAFAGIGVVGGQVSEGIRLDQATVLGALINQSGASITAANGNAIHIVASELDGGIHNYANAEIGSASGYAALLIEGSSEVFNGIVNEGHIGPSAVGPQIGGGLEVLGSSIYGGIDNSGTIDARGNSGAIVLDNSVVLDSTGAAGGTLTNSGSIDATNALNGIDLRNGSQIGAIENTNYIGAGGNGISIDSSTVSAGITNGGTIIASGSAIYLFAAQVTGGIYNQANALLSGANTIAIGLTTTVTGDITNAGTIDTVAGYSGVQLTGGTVTGSLINSGTIGNGGSSAGVFVSGTSSIASINNSGTISGLRALDLGDTNTAIVVNNSGALIGNVMLGSNRLDLLGSTAIVYGDLFGSSGSIVNIGSDSTHTATFTATGNFSGLSQFAINSNSLLNTYNGLQIGATTLRNAGTLSIAAGDTVNVTGNYVQAAGGVLRTGLASETSYGKLAVSGNVDLSASGAIAVDVIGAPVIAAGTVMSNVITAGGTLTSGALTVTDNSFLFDLGAVRRGNAINLRILGSESNSTTSAVNSTGNKSAAGAAVVFDQLIANGASGDMQTVITALGTLGSAQEVADAVTQTVPLSAAAGSQTILSSLNSVNRVVDLRQQGESGVASGDGFLGNDVVWLKPFGSWANQDDHNGIFGFDARSHGLIVGVDGQSGATRLGAAFAYSTTDVSSNAAQQSADIDGYNAVLYGGYDLDEQTSLNLQADAGFYQTSGEREITFASLNRKAKADFDSWSGHLGAELAHALSLSQSTVFTPSVRADYTYLSSESYTEHGADALNLNVDSNTTEAFVLGVDGKLAFAVATKTQLVANLGVGYDLINDQSSITSAFAGAPSASFATRGIDPSPWLTRGGLGVIGQVSDTVEVSARYDAEVREGFDNQTASVKVSWLF